MAKLGHLRGRRQARQGPEGAFVRQDSQGAVGDSQCARKGSGEAARMAKPSHDKAKGIHRQFGDQEGWMGHPLRVVGIS